MAMNGGDRDEWTTTDRRLCRLEFIGYLELYSERIRRKDITTTKERIDPHGGGTAISAHSLYVDRLTINDGVELCCVYTVNRK